MFFSIPLVIPPLKTVPFCEEKQPLVTWAAAGFRGCQLPSSGPIYFCTSPWCCTAASRCFPRSGWASAPRRQSRRSREFLRSDSGRWSHGRSSQSQEVKKLQRWEPWPTFGSEAHPGQVGLGRQRQGFAVDQLTLPVPELQQLDTQSLIAVKTSS